MSLTPGIHDAIPAATDAEQGSPARPLYRLWLNDDHTLCIRLWEDDTLEVLTRETSDYEWGSPVLLSEATVR